MKKLVILLDLFMIAVMGICINTNSILSYLIINLIINTLYLIFRCTSK
jgi:hypothetical protein